jgi:uncharacterized membrane protein
MTDDVGYAGYEDRTMPIICYALYLLAFATGITAIIGVIIAYTQRSTAGPVMHSHYTFLIRTFWLGIVVAIVSAVVGGILMAIGAVLTVILIGFPIMAVAGLFFCVAAVWFAVRCILGLVYLSRGEAYPRPYAVLA